MKFLVDADLPRRTADLFRQYGHEAEDVRSAGLGEADDQRIAAYAQANGQCLVTGDFGFADTRNYPASEYAGIVVLQVPRDATAAVILAILDSLLRQPDVLEGVPGRLAIVAFGRVRLRP
jgi:predicted nuclease of predicted toxin-antitoxin system